MAEIKQVECAECAREGIPPEEREAHHLRQGLDLANMLLRDYREGRYGAPRVITSNEEALRAEIEALKAEGRRLQSTNDDLKAARSVLADLRDWVATVVPAEVPHHHAMLARMDVALSTLALLKRAEGR